MTIHETSIKLSKNKTPHGSIHYAICSDYKGSKTDDFYLKKGYFSIVLLKT